MKSLSDHEKFKSLKNRVTSELRIAKFNYFATLSQSTSNSPKKALNLLNSAIRRKCKSHIESIHTSAGEFTSPNVIANLFNNHFSTLFSSLLPAYSSNFDFVKSCLFHFVPIMADEILNILQLLNVDKVMGPDGISACILKVSASAIADSLAALIWMMLPFPLIGKKLIIFQCIFSLTIDQFQYFLILPKYLSPLSISRFSLTFHQTICLRLLNPDSVWGTALRTCYLRSPILEKSIGL